MFCVILKELRQTVHHAWVTGIAALLFVSFAALVAGKLCGRQYTWQIFLFCAGVQVFCVALIVLAAHRWKRERGDAALDMMLTTPLSEPAIVFGKFFAFYLPVLILLALNFVLENGSFASSSGWQAFMLDALFFAALGSVLVALASLRTRRKEGVDWSGVAAILLALPLAIQHFLLHLEALGAVPPGQLAVPFYRAFTLAAGFAATGFLIAFAGLKKTTDDRMRDLHIFYLASVLAVPAVFRYFGGENWQSGLQNACGTAADLFLAASLFERSEVTARQKKSRLFPVFTTGSMVVWLWSIALIAAAGFAAPSRELFYSELGSWCFGNFYVALTRCIGEKMSPVKRGAIAFAVLIAAAAFGSFSVIDPKFAALSMSYFHYYPFSWKFFGALFVVAMLLRAGEFRRFIKSLLK